MASRDEALFYLGSLHPSRVEKAVTNSRRLNKKNAPTGIPGGHFVRIPVLAYAPFSGDLHPSRVEKAVTNSR